LSQYNVHSLQVKGKKKLFIGDKKIRRLQSSE
jgi:hypothetical protein